MSQVLSDPEKRAIYDRYGEEGLKGQVPPQGAANGGFANSSSNSTSFRYQPRDAEEIFAELFGGNRNFSRVGSTNRFGGQGEVPRTFDGKFGGFGGKDSGLRPSFGDSATPSTRKAAPVENKLQCSLEELYNGSTRKLKIYRDIVDRRGNVKTLEEFLSIEVKPGWKKGTKIIFPEKGNEQPNVVAADLVFILDERPHEVFKREGNDLVMEKTISLVEALTGYTLVINTLDARVLRIPITEVIYPAYEKVILKEGMPIAKEKGKKGNLRVKFNIKFPAKLSAEQKTSLKYVLGGVG
ncbi:hypothetical protein O6H91_09G091200 [Diphasiastrum complanatum]|uniref:Uncharacterized protein n=1 Tax=Diphasiastrum complanatum TaxID=34168 RepID=A0ACC2CRV4_DIPCM|nr:hypothetical protein O6H91_09G091200 [Diphasiastrum complanatum]